MNLTFLFIFFIVATIIIDFLTFKIEEEKELKPKRIKRLTKNFISICLTYLVFSFLLTIFFKNFLIIEDKLISNTIVGIIALIFQILNIYSFYDNYQYSYGYLTYNLRTTEKVLIFFFGIITILFNEFILSSIKLPILSFDISFFNILIKMVTYSAYIFMPLLIIIREITRIIKTTEKEEFEFE